MNEFDWKDENGICYDKDGGADLAALNMLKYGLPPALYNFTNDTHHTTHYTVAR